MAKRMQEQKEDNNRIVAKTMPTAMNLAFSVSTSSSTVNSPIASKSQGILKASGGWMVQGNLTQEEEEIPIPTQRRVLKDGKKDAQLDGCTGKPVATE